jgi:hypothetical protein
MAAGRHAVFASLGLGVALLVTATVLAQAPPRPRPGAAIRPAPPTVLRPESPPPAPAPLPTAPTANSAKPQRTITADGAVETTYPDGHRRITRPGVCGFTVIAPDGRRTTASCSQVPVATPPIPDATSKRWLDAHNAALLDVIGRLLENQSSVDNYLRNTEANRPLVYDQIRLRTELIELLVAPF